MGWEFLLPWSFVPLSGSWWVVDEYGFPAILEVIAGYAYISMGGLIARVRHRETSTYRKSHSGNVGKVR